MKFNRENIDRHHLRPPVLAILLETIESSAVNLSNFNRLTGTK